MGDVISRITDGISGPVLTVVMDGIGIGTGDAGDAVAKANTPVLDLFARQPLSTKLRAHGMAVGMPSDGDMGNSEVGHNAIGAGRVFDQGAKLVSAAIEEGTIFESELWGEISSRCVGQKMPLHLIGLLSDGNVHSHIDHLFALIAKADAQNFPEVYIHVLLDGRDVEKTSALTYIDQLEATLGKISKKEGRSYRIASGGGRMSITMDRYNADWPMVERGWQTHVEGKGPGFPTARAAVEAFRAKDANLIDQHIPAFVIEDGGKPVAPIKKGSAVIAFNFRGDRMMQLCQAFEQEEFDHFKRGAKPDVLFCGMTLFDGDTHTPKKYLVAPPAISGTLGELLSDAGVTQYACSETQKFGHVTYFWNGNRSGKFNNTLERYEEIKSRDMPFDERPEMRAPEITDAVIRAIDSDWFECGRINFANGDMVGHTGNFDATVDAVQTVDKCLGRIAEPIIRKRGALIVTADHGNADDMFERDKESGQTLKDSNGNPVAKTSHSLNPVPFYVLMHPEDRQHFELAKHSSPGLANVAGTILTLLGYRRPDNYLPGLLSRLSN